MTKTKSVRALALLLALAACGSQMPQDAPGADLAVSAQAEARDATAARLAPRMTIAAEMGEQTVAAVDLWQAATSGAYAPELTIGECDGTEDICLQMLALVPPCAGEAEPWGCTVPGLFGPTRIEVLRTVPREAVVSTIAHELGHTLGLHHDAGSLMDPTRDMLARYFGCITAETLALVGVAEPVPACAHSGS